MLNLILCDYSDPCIALKGPITVLNTGTATASSIRNNEVVFKNCVPFTDCICEINNTQIYNAKDNDVLMDMHNLIKCG